LCPNRERSPPQSRDSSCRSTCRRGNGFESVRVHGAGNGGKRYQFCYPSRNRRYPFGSKPFRLSAVQARESHWLFAEGDPYLSGFLAIVVNKAQNYNSPVQGINAKIGARSRPELDASGAYFPLTVTLASSRS